ncbi:MAG: hypothetical protein A2Z31_03270 [candidate division NC10 bacterium RBG_16_65_8]|nr:MAG: hypothetical protein A2Z31_03270 [candidate division NC10 bacterium RBG_16_65_8]
MQRPRKAASSIMRRCALLDLSYLATQTSLEAAREVLTPKRLELLRAIRRGRPASVSQLTQLVRRDFKNVHADVQALARYGLVSLTTTPAGRRTTVPRVPFSVLEFRIAV